MGFWAWAGWTAAQFLFGYLTREEPPKPEERTEADVRPTSSEGRPVPIVWGKVRVRDLNHLWAGDFSKRLIDNSDVDFHLYYYGVAMGICRGPNVQLHEIWYDNKLIWPTATATVTVYDNAPITVDGTEWRAHKLKFNGPTYDDAIWFDGKFYTGSETQTADTYLATQESEISGFRGVSYFTSIATPRPYGLLGKSPRLAEFSAVVARFPSALLDLGELGGSGYTGTENIIEDGANPMEVLYECLTNTTWGCSVSSSEIDTQQLQEAAATLYTQGMGIQYSWSNTTTVDSVIKMVEDHAAGTIRMSPTTGLIQFKLFRDDYTLASMPLVNETNIDSLKSFSRMTWDETSNFIRVRFMDSRKDYVESYAMASDVANEIVVGSVNTKEVQAPMTKTASVANAIAWRELRESSFPGARISFTMDRTEYDVAEGDVLRFSWSDLGISEMGIRVTKIGMGDRYNDGTITIEAVEDFFTGDGASWDDPEDSGWTDPTLNPDPFQTADQFAIECPGILSRFHSLAAPGNPAETFPRILTGARDLNNESPTYLIGARWSATSGGWSALPYLDLGNGYHSWYRATLNGALTQNIPAQGGTAIAVTQTSSAAGVTLDDLVDDDLTPQQGGAMVGLCVISPGTSTEEWVVVESVDHDTGNNYNLGNAWRGAMDRSVYAHSSGASIWLLWIPAVDFFNLYLARPDISDGPLANAYYDVKLIPDGLEAADATAVTEFRLTGWPRRIKPLICDEMKINGSRWPTTVAGGGTPGGFTFTWKSRDWRAAVPMIASQHKIGSDNLVPIDDVATFDISTDNPDTLYYNWWLYDLDDTPTPTLRTDHILNGTTSGGDETTGNLTRSAILTAMTGSPTNLASSYKIEIEAVHSYPIIGTVESEDIINFDFACTDAGP